MSRPEKVPLKFSIGRHVVVNEDSGSYPITYKADAIDEQTALKKVIATLHSTADAIEAQGFPYRRVTA
jgi:hypothetical protein